MEPLIGNNPLVRVTFEAVKDISMATEPLSSKFTRLIPNDDRTPYTQVNLSWATPLKYSEMLKRSIAESSLLVSSMYISVKWLIPMLIYCV